MNKKKLLCGVLALLFYVSVFAAPEPKSIPWEKDCRKMGLAVWRRPSTLDAEPITSKHKASE